MKSLLDHLTDGVSEAPSGQLCFVQANQVVEVLGAEVVQEHAISIAKVDNEMIPDNPRNPLPRTSRIREEGFIGFQRDTLLDLLKAKQNEISGSQQSTGTNQSSDSNTNTNDVGGSEGTSSTDWN